MFTLRMTEAQRAGLWAHLLPPDNDIEQAAFLFGRVEGDTLSVVDARLLLRGDFVIQSRYHIELTDEARAGAIKKAHDLGAALIEAHCHPFDGGAEFSWSDEAGLRELVPHVLWRLPDRPYLALVIAPDAFDGLAWAERGAPPTTINGIDVDGTVHRPSGRSQGSWGGGRRAWA